MVISWYGVARLTNPHRLFHPLPALQMRVVGSFLIVLAAHCCASTPTLVSAQVVDQAESKKRDFFEARIRPVLVEHCYACHNSIDTAEGEFVIDHRQAILKGGAGGKVVVPGDADASRLMAILRHEVDGLEMPEGGPKLDNKVLADFEKWIADGLFDPRDSSPSAEQFAAATSWATTFQRRKEWWCFQPIRTVEPPQGKGSPIDRFVRRKLEEAGLQPNQPADPTTLVRRMFLNVIGLPPSPEESIRWGKAITAASDRDEVVGELIDDLLDRPEFGERWARHWMDWIRYADSHGSEGDPGIANAWYYRDYLIRALNADVPVDQLLREHVAGDLLSIPRINEQLGINESAIGPAHWRMVFHGFAPTDALDERVRFTDDQVNAFSKAFLGLTVSCARCHDHKFDAISQKDYYAMFGVLSAARPARTVIDLPKRTNQNLKELTTLKTDIRQAIAKDWAEATRHLESKLQNVEFDELAKQPRSLLQLYKKVRNAASVASEWEKQRIHFSEQRRDWEASRNRDALQRWELADSAVRKTWTTSGTGLRSFADGPTFAVASKGEQALVGIYPTGMYSHEISDKHSARLTSPDVTLDEDSELWLRVIGDGGASARYVVHDYPRNGTVYPVTKLAPQWRWQKYDLDYWTRDKIHVELTAAKDAPLLYGDQPRSWFGVRDVRLQAKGQSVPVEFREHLIPVFDAGSQIEVDSAEDLATAYAIAIKTAVTAWGADEASDAEALLLDAAIRQGILPNTLESLSAARPLIERYRKLESEIVSPTRVPGLEDVPEREQRLYVRGNHKTPSEPVPRRFLEAIDPTPYEATRASRLQLADDLLRRDNPLTRRVLVNRVWHHLFGHGIVRTPDNFGLLGDTPSHPELLDWMAVEFDREGWSLRELIRLIVSSQTWQQSAKASNAAQANDPDNRLLSHANVRRLEAEAIRDSLLFVSANLDNRRGGPPVNGNSTRRSVYVRVQRNALDPFLRVFDFPEPFSAVGRRDVTNVPAQSLTMLNDQSVRRYADRLAARVLEDRALDENQRVERLFRIALARAATPGEIEHSKQYMASTRDQFKDATTRRAVLQTQIEQRNNRIESVLLPVREKLQAELDANPAKAKERLPRPIASYDFAESADDSLGEADGELRDGANLSGSLQLDGRGHVVTKPLNQSIKAKTLEAWVQLKDLGQRGGGVMTLQTPNGVIFDSIVFGERDEREWLAGSNNFARTQPFRGSKETDAKDRLVHVAITYGPDGTITGYRDGKPYGKPYKSNGPIEFKPGQAVISFGVRHLPASGGRMLRGNLFRANLYDRALTAPEVAASASGSVRIVSTQDVYSALSNNQRQTVDQLRLEIVELESQLRSLGKLPSGDEATEAWKELARAILTFKEFLYVQ